MTIKTKIAPGVPLAPVLSCDLRICRLWHRGDASTRNGLNELYRSTRTGSGEQGKVAHELQAKGGDTKREMRSGFEPPHSDWCGDMTKSFCCEVVSR